MERGLERKYIDSQLVIGLINEKMETTPFPGWQKK
jgi:hypothetical protein